MAHQLAPAAHTLTICMTREFATRLLERVKLLQLLDDDITLNDLCIDALELHLDATERADFSELVSLPADLAPPQPGAGNIPRRPCEPPRSGGADHVGSVSLPPGPLPAGKTPPRPGELSLRPGGADHV